MIASLEDIDWQPFLARPLLPPPSPLALDLLKNARILVTGAGGSIGSALALRLAAMRPRHLALLESSEDRLCRLQRVLKDSGSSHDYILGNVRDANLLDDVFADSSPTIVFHAAAYKHVPLLESQPFAAIENNIFGARALVSAAAQNGARVVLLSTDKAVEPVSILGATKRAAELIVLHARGTVLRLGNVLASSGSVAQRFAMQITAGGPISVTGPAARRYFLTLNEAVHLLIAASAEPDRPSLLIPALPVQYFIADLARFMTRTLARGQHIAIEFTTPRPGDKECEKLWTSDENAEPGATNGLQVVESRLIEESELFGRLAELREVLDARELPAAISCLQTLVPGYTPSHALLSLAEQHAPRAAR